MEKSNWKPKIPDYTKQPKVDIEKKRKEYVESLLKGNPKPGEEKERIIELKPSQEVEARHKIQPEKPLFNRFVKIEDFQTGRKVNMAGYGEALKKAQEAKGININDNGKKGSPEKRALTAEEQKRVNQIDSVLAEMEKGMTPKTQAEIDEIKRISELSRTGPMSNEEFDKEIDAVLEKLKQEEQKGQSVG